MKPTTPTLRRLLLHLLLGLSIISLLQTVSADVGISDIEVIVPDEITPGSNFNVNITFLDPDTDDANVDVRIQIEIEGVLVYDDEKRISFTKDIDRNYSISSGDFENIWDENLMNYNCGDNDIEVTVSGDEINTESDSASLEIKPSGDVDKKTLNMDIDPSSPRIDDDITITITDEEDNKLVSGVSIKFTWIDDNEQGEWEDDDASEDASKTDSDGETEFNIEDDFGEYGKYQIDAWKSGYCKATETITVIEGELTIGNPEPLNPKIGEQFKIKVTDGTNPLKGVKGIINDINVRQTVTSGDDGYLKFTINKAGTYTIIINATNYGVFEKQVMVSNPDALTVSITPTPAEVNSPVIIAVYTKGNPLSGVSLTVNRPDGGKDVLTTGGDGKTTYTPRKAGAYTVDASKEGYEASSQSFSVNSALEVQLPDASTILYGTDMTITVVDSSTRVPAAGVLVSGTGVPSLSRTDTMGQYKIKLGSSGQYNFVVSKEGYTDKGFSVTVLCKVSLKTNATSVELEQPVRVSVYDNEKNEYVSGNIAVSGPDGSSDSKTGSEYVLNPTATGTYGIKVSKANCAGEEGSVEVKTKALRFESELKDGGILVRTVSGGKPAAGVGVSIKTPSGVNQTVSSDENGLINLTAAESGNYTITSTDVRYDSETLTVEQKAFVLKKYWWAAVVAVIILLICVLLALMAILFLRSRGKEESTSFKKGRSKLG